MEEKIKARIMDSRKIKRALHRMTTEIIERNRKLKNLVIIGIRTRGIYIGKRISKLIKELEKVEIPVGVLDITLYRDDFSESRSSAYGQKNRNKLLCGQKRRPSCRRCLIYGKNNKSCNGQLD